MLINESNLIKADPSRAIKLDIDIIPTINHWFYLDAKKPNRGEVVIACLDNRKYDFKNIPNFSTHPIMFCSHRCLIMPLCEKYPFPDFRPSEDIIVWTHIKSPHEFREKDPSNKMKCYSHGKFFETREEMIKFSSEWIDMPFDYEEFCNQIRLVLSSALLNRGLQDFTNRDAYWHARQCLGWGKENNE